MRLYGSDCMFYTRCCFWFSAFFKRLLYVLLAQTSGPDWLKKGMKCCPKAAACFSLIFHHCWSLLGYTFLDPSSRRYKTRPFAHYEWGSGYILHIIWRLNEMTTHCKENPLYVFPHKRPTYKFQFGELWIINGNNNPCSQFLVCFESEWDSKLDINIGFSSALPLQCRMHIAAIHSRALPST